MFLDLLFSRLNFYKEDFILRYKAHKAFNIKFNKVDTKSKNLFKSINVERGNWTHNISEWNNYGIKGRDLAKKHLEKLLDLCDKNNIKVALVIYPWPGQILYDKVNSKHVNIWKKFCEQRCENFINLFPLFFDEINQNSKEKVVELFYLKNDVHFNEDAHKKIFEKINTLKFY